MRLLAVLVLAVVVGCLPSYRYGQPSRPRAGASPEEACYQREHVELVPAEATWREQFTRGDVMITNQRSVSGLAFYRGGRRLGPELAMADLDDPELATAYHRILAATASDRRWYARHVRAAFGLALGSLGVAVLTLAYVVSADDPDTDTAMTGVLITGVAGVLSVIPTYLAYRTHRGAFRHDIARRMVTDQLATRAAESTDQHNATVAARCGR